MGKPPHKLHFAILAADTVLFTIEGRDLKVLLIRVKRPPHYTHHWGAPGGLIHPTETAESAARRHLYIKGGIKKVNHLEQLYTFSQIDRDPRGRIVSVAYLALIPQGKVPAVPDKDIHWFPMKKLPLLAYDHKEIVRMALERLRAKLEYTNIAHALLPKEFTLGEIQRVYEIALGKKIDKRNFRKKILALSILKRLPRRRLGRNRPAVLYRFTKRGPEIVEIL